MLRALSAIYDAVAVVQWAYAPAPGRGFIGGMPPPEVS
ncbi:hypothetical protein FHR33_004678 [Nonomuraea dietziae]|jgi:hypothetical protein|uniref:Uncharacterized protein n=1 Tax=Nonomuraea dietziae TaxID=65515 RepID=A0A7W5VAX1_9ACTN|nr:hypothetical protein [Nonomuraea dietziae]